LIMKKKELIFTFGLCLLMCLIWIAGELVMGLWLPVYPWVYIVWRVGIVVVTLGINIWHSLREDRSEENKTPAQAKYERKTQKRKQ